GKGAAAARTGSPRALFRYSTEQPDVRVQSEQAGIARSALSGALVRERAWRYTETVQLTLTERAAEAVRSRAREADVPGWLLRIAVVAGGCCGLIYELYFVPEPSGEDELVESGGVRLAVDAASARMLGLLVCVGVMAAAALYMALVGLYHTVLALFGWDGGPGIIRKNPHYVPGSDEPLPDGTPLQRNDEN